jgi:hypothetical protein
MNPTNTAKEPNAIQRLLWWSSGATSSVLKDCPTEHRKYSAIGAAMLSIPVIASLGAGFALYQSYENQALAIAGGLGWGILIYIVDRLIQITIRKDANGRKAFWMGLPRLVMIVVLSFLMTDPILHKLFEADINAEMSRKAQLAGANAQSVAETRYGREIAEIEQRNSSLNESLNKLKQERDRKFDEWMAEGAGTSGTGVPGKGIFYAEKERAYEKADEEYKSLKTQLEPQIELNITQIRELRQRQDQEVSLVTSDQQKARGLLARNSALFSVIKRDRGAAVIAILLMLAFILLESTPLTIKLISQRGTYDERFDRVEKEQFFLEEQLLDQNKETIRFQKELALHFGTTINDAVKQRLSQVANAVNKNQQESLSNEHQETLNRFIEELNKRIRQNLPTQTEQPQTTHAPQPPRTDSPASLLVHLPEPEGGTFCLNINRVESEVTGQDLFYALRGIDKSLLPRGAEQPPLSFYRVVNGAGVEVEADKSLFAQLQGGRSVNLVLPAQDVSDATQ